MGAEPLRALPPLRSLPRRAKDAALAPEETVRRACEAAGVPVADVVGPRKTRWIVRARREAARTLRASYPSMSMATIGEFLGGRDPSTISYLLRGKP